MTPERKPDARVEAAARVVDPRAFDLTAWPLVTFGQSLDEARAEAQTAAREDAARILAAADAVRREGLAERVAEAMLSVRWPDGARLDGVTKRTVDMLAAAVVAAITEEDRP